MSLLIAITGWDPEAWRERFERNLPDHAVFTLDDNYDPASISYAACWHAPHGLLATLPNLEAVYSLGAGVDHLFADAGLPDVPLVRVVDPDLTNRMSEWVVMNVLLHHRRAPTYLAQQGAALWQPWRDQPAAREVRVGVMGLGELGRDAARKLTALGFDVAGWSRSGRPVENIEVYGAEKLDAFLARTDILVSLLPLTEETRGILDRTLFEKLARNGPLGGPVLLNAGRGGSQKDADIAAALQDGTLIAASLDVFEAEPLPADSPLWGLPNIVITPHSAAESSPDAVSAFIARQIARIEAGETPEGLVERSRGY